MIRNKVFEFERDDNSGFVFARVANDNGDFLFLWQDEFTLQRVEIPVGVIQNFETFKALCRQFEHPLDLETWYKKKLKESQKSIFL